MVSPYDNEWIEQLRAPCFDGRLCCRTMRRAARDAEGLHVADSVEKGGSNSMYWREAEASLCGLRGLYRDQLGHLAKVLGGGGEDEFVTGAIWASQA